MRFCFFFNDTATTEIYTYGHTLSLHDALPICIGRQRAVRAGSLGIFRIHEDGIALDAEVDEISDRAVRKKLAGKDFRRFPRIILRLRESDGKGVASCDYREARALRSDSIICGVQHLEFDFIAPVDESLGLYLEDGAGTILI